MIYSCTVWPKVYGQLTFTHIACSKTMGLNMEFGSFCGYNSLHSGVCPFRQKCICGVQALILFIPKVSWG